MRQRGETLQRLWAVAQAGALAWGLYQRRKAKALTRPDLPPDLRRDLNSNMLRIETAIHPELDMADMRVRGQTASKEKPRGRIGQIWQIAIEAGKQWVDRRAASKGAALSLYTLFSLAPMLVLVVAMAGFFFGADNVRNVLVEQMQSLMGAKGADAIKVILAGTQREDSSFWAGIVSGVLVLISATSAFAELKDSLDELWDNPKPQTSGLWGFLRERVLSFGLVAVLALMLMISLVVSAALDVLQNLWGGGSGEATLWTLLLQVLAHAVSFGVVVLLFAAIYKYLPNANLRWKDVLTGAVITAVLFLLGKAAIGIYISKADIETSYGAAGSLVILITWVYYSAQIFFYGSLFTHEYAMRLGSRKPGGKEVPERVKVGAA